MKRKLLALLLASVMVLSLVACGQKETCLLYTSPSPRDA